MTALQKLPANQKGRDYITGDIHGEFDRVRALLDRVGFDGSKDRLFTVGDMVDRGPQSVDVVEWLDQPWFFSTRGNHEQMAINFAAGHNHAFHYEMNGGRWFIDLQTRQQQLFSNLFNALPIAIEIEGEPRFGIVHAEVERGDWSVFEGFESLPSGLRKKVAETALWARWKVDANDTTPVSGVDMVFVGHTPVDEIPTRLGNVAYIDSGAVFGGPMFLQCLSTGEAWSDSP